MLQTLKKNTRRRGGQWARTLHKMPLTAVHWKLPPECHCTDDHPRVWRHSSLPRCVHWSHLPHCWEGTTTAHHTQDDSKSPCIQSSPSQWSYKVHFLGHHCHTLIYLPSLHRHRPSHTKWWFMLLLISSPSYLTNYYYSNHIEFTPLTSHSSSFIYNQL